jgi:hypothetical protein
MHPKQGCCQLERVALTHEPRHLLSHPQCDLGSAPIALQQGCFVAWPRYDQLASSHRQPLLEDRWVW